MSRPTSIRTVVHNQVSTLASAWKLQNASSCALHLEQNSYHGICQALCGIYVVLGRPLTLTYLTSLDEQLSLLSGPSVPHTCPKSKIVVLGPVMALRSYLQNKKWM